MNYENDSERTSVGSATPVKSPSQVENQLVSINAKLVSLAKAIGLIEERLSDVLRNDDNVSSEEKSEGTVLVGLANKLGNVLEEIVSHEKKLRNILDRIEL